LNIASGGSKPTGRRRIPVLPGCSKYRATVSPHTRMPGSNDRFRRNATDLRVPFAHSESGTPL
jgi:hypothetical protein